MEATNVVKTGSKPIKTVAQNTAVAERLLEARNEVARLKAEAAAEALKLKAAKEIERQARKEAKVVKEAKIAYTRVQAVGETMRLNPDKPVEDVVTLADALYTERTGKASNLKETRAITNFGVNFLKGYKSE